MMRESRMNGAHSRSGFEYAEGFCVWTVRALMCALAVVVGSAATAAAQNALPTRQAVEQWLSQNANAKPAFKPGDVLTVKDLEQDSSVRAPRLCRRPQLS